MFHPLKSSISSVVSHFTLWHISQFLQLPINQHSGASCNISQQTCCGCCQVSHLLWRVTLCYRFQLNKTISICVFIVPPVSATVFAVHKWVGGLFLATTNSAREKSRTAKNITVITNTNDKCTHHLQNHCVYILCLFQCIWL